MSRFAAADASMPSLSGASGPQPSIYGPTASEHSEMDVLFGAMSFSSLAKIPTKPAKPGDLGPGGIYHEKQVKLQCAMHSINNILQENRITEEQLRKTAKQLDRAQQRLTGGRAVDYLNDREDGFHNALVVTAVFNGLGYEVTATRAAMLELEHEVAILAHRARHWFALRRLGDGWFDLNSCLNKPEHYDNHNLREYARFAEAQGYRLFVVRGSWPVTALEQDAQALSSAVRACLRPPGQRQHRIVCSPAMEVMVDGNSRGVKEHRVPRWLQFGVHWFSPTRFQSYSLGSRSDWQEAELGFRKKQVAVKTKKSPASLEDQEISSSKKKGQDGSIMDFLEEEAGEDAEEIEEEVVLEDVRAYRPIFVLCQIFLIIAFWLTAALISPAENGWVYTLAGLETIIPKQTLCQASLDCEDLRFQAWRWFTYQYTHSSLSHLAMNAFLILLCGLPLEQYQGTWPMILLFNTGALTGGICAMVWDPHSPLAGCSAGAYALIFAHVADLGLNWREARYRWGKLALLLVVVIMDVVQSNVYLNYFDAGSSVASHVAHMGGAVAGLCLGVFVTRRIVATQRDRVRQGVGLILWLGTMGLHFGLLASFPVRAPYEDQGWCWHRQIFNQTLFSDDIFHCVRCADPACVTGWQAQRWVSPVNWRACEFVKGWSA